MRLYDYHAAPNPRLVRIYLAEKGISIPTVQVDITKGEHQSAKFLKHNPMGRVPVLELDDSTYLSETVAICRYFEVLHPEPALFGSDAKNQAVVEMWRRRMEFDVALPAMMAMRHTHPMFAHEKQIEAYAELSRQRVEGTMQWLNEELGGREYIAGDTYTIADITALIGFDFGRIVDLRVPEHLPALWRWYQSVRSRPSSSS